MLMFADEGLDLGRFIISSEKSFAIYEISITQHPPNTYVPLEGD